MRVVACRFVANGIELPRTNGNDGIVLWAVVKKLGVMKVDYLAPWVASLLYIAEVGQRCWH